MSPETYQYYLDVKKNRKFLTIDNKNSKIIVSNTLNFDRTAGLLGSRVSHEMATFTKYG